MTNHSPHTIIIGAGLTGLTAAYSLQQKGVDVLVLEKENRIGGQIHTFHEDGFTFESGPNTGIIAHPEVAELFSLLKPFGCSLVTARAEAKQRWIWKNGCFHTLPVGLKNSIRTTLFTWKDKLRILGEPFRPKGTDPDESISDLVRRRLGISYERYAVDPFISGVYAGDPERLVTRFALPKLYNLEHTYGSFIKGAIAKMRQTKSDRDRLATREVFSAEGGLQALIDALGNAIGDKHMVTDARDVRVLPAEKGFAVTYQAADDTCLRLHCQQVITTVGAYALPALLPFVAKEQMQHLANLHYAPVVQVSVGFKDVNGIRQNAFGGLIPSCEQRHILGILFPSSCFSGRAPEAGAVYSVFLGGVRHPEVIHKSDADIIRIVLNELHQMLSFPVDKYPDLIRIFRHPHAIPQYEQSSGRRFDTIEQLQHQYSGLVIAGNLRNGIGMADRIKQGMTL
jgi:protoporphyrinogen oxidase